jgi:hypothetical protein
MFALIISAAEQTLEIISTHCISVILSGHWCDIIILNVHAPTEHKINEMKDGF